jgi:hypothetical protein
VRRARLNKNRCSVGCEPDGVPLLTSPLSLPPSTGHVKDTSQLQPIPPSDGFPLLTSPLSLPPSTGHDCFTTARRASGPLSLLMRPTKLLVRVLWWSRLPSAGSAPDAGWCP